MDNRVFGIDVSRYQKGMDFAKAASEGVTFAVIKASEGDYTDPCFVDNYERARRAGLKVGAYHFLKATDADGVKRDAKFLVDRCLKGRVFEYPIFVDVEDGTLRKLTKKELSSLVSAFCDTLEDFGCWAGFYTNLDWYMNALDGESLAKRYSFWFAYWGKSCPLSLAQMWQFGGNVNMQRSNQIAGVVCDRDFSFVDFPAKIAAKGLNGMKRPGEPPHESPAEHLATLSVGERVRMKQGAPVYGSTSLFAPWVYETVLFVREISGSRVVVSTSMTGAVTGAVDRKYLVKA